MKPFAIACAAVIGLSFAGPVSASAQHSHEGGQPMPHGGEPMHGEMHAKPDAAAIEGKGVVNAVDSVNRSVNLSHEPIAAIGWPSMTMDMEVADGVALTEIQDGEAVTFTLERGPDGIYMITGITPAP